MVVAPDFETLLIGLGNYGECWSSDDEQPERAAGVALQDRLMTLGWPEEFRRFWPGQNEAGMFD